MHWFKRLFGLASTPAAPGSAPYSVRRVTLKNPLIISSPRIGFLNLLGAAGQSIVEEDKAALGPLFASVEESDTNPPVCDVLMIYAQLESDGRITGVTSNLREIIHSSRAPIAIVATENDGKNYIAASKRPGSGRANLVMTIKRDGPAFTSFFTRLFGRMFQGQSMVMAWVELAPQGRSVEHKDVPGSIFAAEVSHIIFK